MAKEPAATKAIAVTTRSFLKASPQSLHPAIQVFVAIATRYNPEELLVASLSSCHMLWYLHLCAVNKVCVLEYRDAAVGTMEERPDGSGAFARVLLRPAVTIRAGDDRSKAMSLHSEAHHMCFIANSVNFPVEVEAEIREAAAASPAQ